MNIINYKKLKIKEILNENKSIATTFAFLTVIIILSNNNKSIDAEIDPSNWFEYEDDKITMKYPPNWQIERSTSKFDVSDFHAIDRVNKIIFQGLSNDFGDEYSKSITDKEIYESAKDLFFGETVSNRHIESYEKGDFSIGDKESFADLYSVKYEIGGYDFGVLFVMSIYDNKYYSIQASVLQENYEDVEQTIHDVIRSISLK
ncbi:MAG: hypothetical protein ACPKPY_09790 [Nitrososphaeraceae archaeon]